MHKLFLIISGNQNIQGKYMLIYYEKGRKSELTMKVNTLQRRTTKLSPFADMYYIYLVIKWDVSLQKKKTKNPIQNNSIIPNPSSV